jgi:hypothetical protein
MLDATYDRMAMSRTARTKGVSMRPEDEVRWDRLQGSRRTSDFVRHLLDLEEEGARRRAHNEALEELIRFQAELPPAWKDEAHYDLDDADEYTPIPAEIAEASFDISPVLASWREHEEP